MTPYYYLVSLALYFIKFKYMEEIQIIMQDGAQERRLGSYKRYEDDEDYIEPDEMRQALLFFKLTSELNYMNI